MCKNAQGTAVSLLTAIEPTLKSLLTIEGVINTPAAQAALKEYDEALAAVTAWKSGTPAQDALQAINILQAAINLLPIPADYQVLANVILAGIQTVIGVLSANSPAPAPTPSDATASPEDIQAHHQAEIAADTVKKVQALVPGFKRSLFHSPEGQYKKAWNDEITKLKLPASLKVQ
jgi:hypothetical protein